MMTANEIREKFLKFFESKDHKIIASASLVLPEGTLDEDKTVLFTTAGMQQFKQQFLGNVGDFTRAASCQKCLRTDDLDQVGKTPFHHTFFEMLGNFSFGDYFKEDAIEWAWEFLTKELKIPDKKLWVSVYKEDFEAQKIWLENVKIPKDRLVRLGDKSNFWPSEAKEKGPNGPCGPCSEIFYDYGVNPDCDKKEKCNPDCNCGRFSEVWNLVFTQFNRKDGGILEPLPAKNIDTGMGLERLVAVVQEKRSNYETDLFEPIIREFESQLGDELKNKFSQIDKFIIADHIRATVFGIGDWVIPTNEGRGHVIKKLINESTHLLIKYYSGVPVIQIHKLVRTVCQIMESQYPELSVRRDEIILNIKAAERACIVTHNMRFAVWEREVQKIEDRNDLSDDEKDRQLGRRYFFYHDTYGLDSKLMMLSISTIERPSSNIKLFSDARLRKIQEYYLKFMQEQQSRSRAASKMTGDVFADAELNLNVPKTKFLGYESFVETGKILKLFKSSPKISKSLSFPNALVGNPDEAMKEVESVVEGDSIKIVLDQTPFYAESGGQIGDIGFISKGNFPLPNPPHKGEGTIRITDTQKIADVFIHVGTVTKGSFKINDVVRSQIDEERRRSIMRNHTATHLLQAALRKVLGSHVQQQGSLVAEDRLRFDFTHHQPITKEQMLEIESWINSTIMSCDAVDKKVMPLSEAKASGALAFFAEKYGETVRVVSMDGYSKEFCGGTHLKFTGEIGLFKITGESSIAQGIRRIEAVTGNGALEFMHLQEKNLEAIAQTIKSPVKEVVGRVETQNKRLKDLEKEFEALRFETIRNSLETILNSAQIVGQSKIITATFKNVDAPILRKVSDLIKQKVSSGVVALGSNYLDNAFILVALTDDLVQKGMKANELIKSIASVIDGTGGGRPDLAQAGSKNVQKIESAINQARQLIAQKISSL